MNTTKKKMNHIGIFWLLSGYHKKPWFQENNWYGKPTLTNVIVDTKVVTQRPEEIISQNDTNGCMCQNNTLQNNIYKAYILVWGQCSDGLKYKIESLNVYAKTYKYFNTFKLSKHIKLLFYITETKN